MDFYGSADEDGFDLRIRGTWQTLVALIKVLLLMLFTLLTAPELAQLIHLWS
jgi:hypothetical protein